MKKLTGDPYRDVKELGAHLAEGEQRSGETCPFCYGGHSRERSLSIKREKGEIVFNCHRASCRTKGSVLVLFSDEVVVNTKKREPRSDIIPKSISQPHLHPLNEEQVKLLETKFGFSKDEITRNGWMWDNHTDRIWLPIKGLSKLQIGFENKSLKGATPKSVVTLHRTEFPLAHFNVRYPGEDFIILLEDMFSAAKAARRYNTVALIGTNFSNPLADALVKARFHNIVLILDKDAYQKSLVYKNRFGELFHTFRTIQPPKDLKYMTDEEIRVLVEGK